MKRGSIRNRPPRPAAEVVAEVVPHKPSGAHLLAQKMPCIGPRCEERHGTRQWFIPVGNRQTCSDECQEDNDRANDNAGSQRYRDNHPDKMEALYARRRKSPLYKPCEWPPDWVAEKYGLLD